MVLRSAEQGGELESFCEGVFIFLEKSRSAGKVPVYSYRALPILRKRARKESGFPNNEHLLTEGIVLGACSI